MPSSLHWIKFYHEILDDPKMARLPDHLWRRVGEIFLLAGRANDGGFLPRLDDIAWTLRTTPDELERDLCNLEADPVHIVERRDGRWLVIKFIDRQGPSPVKERVAAFRERQRQGGNTTVTARYSTCNACNTPDSDSDSDTDADIDTDAPPVAEDKPPTKAEKQNAIRLALENHFTDLTKLPRPKTGSDKQKRAAATSWYQPLREIADLVEWDEQAGKDLITAAVQRLIDLKYTMNSPNSILKTAIALAAEAKRNRSGNSPGPPAAPVAVIVKPIPESGSIFG